LGNGSGSWGLVEDQLRSGGIATTLVATPFELRVPTNSRTLSLSSSGLTVQDHVKFYASRFEGKLFGLIPVVFTPDSPPLLILPELLFTDANIQLVYVRSDVLTAPDLTIAYTS
jgi:hypothetical protein